MGDKPSYRLIAAAVILIIYFIVAGILLVRIFEPGIEEEGWKQVVVIFTAIGALATTAAGVLFGAEVQQANVRHAFEASRAAAAAVELQRHAVAEALDRLEEPHVSAGGVGDARAILRRSLASPIPTSD